MSVKTGAISAALATALVLAGCASATPGSRDSSATESPIARSSSTPSPPTPAPAKSSPTPSPATPAPWTISADGFGPVQIGDDVAEAITDLRPVGVPLPTTCGNPAITFLGPTGSDQSNAPLLLATGEGLQKSRVVGIVISGSEWRTGAGIGVGSRVADLRSAYPSARLSSRADAAPQFVVEGNPGWITFQTESADAAAVVNLVSVIAGSEPPTEYCG